MEKDFFREVYLLKKSIIDELTDAEQQQLNKLLEDPHLEKIYEQMRDGVFVEEQLKLYAHYSATHGYRNFRSRVGKNHRTIFVRPLFAAAALFLLALVGTWWLLWEKQPVQTAVTRNTLAVIPAGTQKAQLILADGQVVDIAEKSTHTQSEAGAQIAIEEGTVTYQKGIEQPIETVYNKLITPLGGECYLVLEDGTKVWLNAGSTLQFPVAFVAAERKVFLEGEAYFDVTPNTKPFLVETSFGSVTVLGTAFGITAYSDESTCVTTLVRGKISFTTDTQAPMYALPGEQIVATKTGEMWKQEVDVEEFVGWKDGLYVFRQCSIAQIMKTLERWYNISVTIEDDELSHLQYTGNLKRYDHINVILDALKSTGDIEYTIDGNQIKITSYN